jgi:molybdopterin synthase sulfur carrier subunit
MKLLYFAWIRERIGRGEEDVSLPDNVRSVADLLQWLKGRGGEYANALEHDALVRVAIDRRHVGDRSAAIGGASEIALFPPMTGG